MSSGNKAEMFPLGSAALGDGFSFTAWAPKRKTVSVRVIFPSEQTVAMTNTGDGYFRVHISGLKHGALYFYELDGNELRPDPASRYQPEGVHGPSMAIDIRTFKRTGIRWQNHPIQDYITYELHIGTFTSEGTFGSAEERIPYLRDLGVTAVELMPVAQFPGNRNWGYDGVYPYAVQDSYGGPEGLIALIDAFHEAGIAVILDVVYNHLGPEGNYLRSFGPYFTDRYKTPWGEAVNFDGPGRDGVRRFFIDNALYWLFEFGIDALRLDAVHGIFDKSPVHILREMNDTVKARPGGQYKYLIAESDLNDARLVDPVRDGGYGLDAQWSDDFHHSLHTLLTGENDGYYRDFGSTRHLAKAYTEGFVYTGEHSAFRGRPHGTPSVHIPTGRLVVHSQTHDQVGNRMMGDRLSASLSPDLLRLAAACTVLSPYLPLIFMGEEYAETAPFQYFVSHTDPDLLEAVRLGRQEEFSSFAWKGTPPDPADEATFIKSKLNMDSALVEHHKEILEFYKYLIRLRRNHPALRDTSRDRMDIIHIPEDATILLGIWDKPADNMLLQAVCFKETPVSFTPPVGGKWPSTGEWIRLIETSGSETASTSAKIGEVITVGPMDLVVFEHLI